MKDVVGNVTHGAEGKPTFLRRECLTCSCSPSISMCSQICRILSLFGPRATRTSMTLENSRALLQHPFSCRICLKQYLVCQRQPENALNLTRKMCKLKIY